MNDSAAAAMSATATPSSRPRRAALIARVRRGGLADLIDGWVLSYEHGVQKPDPSIFELSLQAAGAPAQDVLMVGDRASHDDAASGLGIDTLILPARARAGTDESARLDGLVRLVG